MNRNTTVVSSPQTWAMLCVALAFPCACGADGALTLDPSAGDPTEADAAEAAPARVLAALSVGEGEVTFYVADTQNGPEVSVGEAFPVGAASPMEELMAEKPTHLEVFLALAPDEEPPALLVDLHAEEAALRGRQDSSVRALDVSIDKWSLADCYAYIFNNQAGEFHNQWGKVVLNLGTYGWVNLGGSSSYTTEDQAAMGNCNPPSSGKTLNAHYERREYLGAGQWTSFSSMCNQVIPPNSYRRCWPPAPNPMHYFNNRQLTHTSDYSLGSWYMYNGEQ
jgi:hypothetical protein